MHLPAQNSHADEPDSRNRDRTAHHYLPFLPKRKVGKDDGRKIFDRHEETKAYSGQPGPARKVQVVSEDTKHRDENVRLNEPHAADDGETRRQYEQRRIERVPRKSSGQQKYRAYEGQNTHGGHDTQRRERLEARERNEEEGRRGRKRGELARIFC